MKLDLVRRLNAEIAARRAAIVETELSTGVQRLIAEDEIGREPDAYGKALRAGRSTTVDDGRLFLNVHVPPPRLAIVGAVHVSQALAPMARLAGFAVEIVDPRTAFATPERFPETRIVAEWPERAFGERPLDAYSALAALTHDPKIDDPALVEALKSGCFYVGALGSRRTHAARLERLGDAGLADDLVSRIEAPIGADIGAQSPAEIAVAILASVVAALRRRPLGGAPAA